MQDLIRLRQALPVLRRTRFLNGNFDEALQVADVRWIDAGGHDISDEQWGDGSMRCFGLVLDGRAPVSGIRTPASDATVLMVFNAHHDVVEFTLPEIPGTDQWNCLVDTNQPSHEALPSLTSGDVYQVTGRSVLVFALEATGATQRVFDRLERARKA